MTSSAPKGEFSRVLSRMREGQASLHDLLPIVYAELRSTADRMMRAEHPGHTLQPTALVHEALLRLVDGDGNVGDDRRHFLAVAARAMRNLLVDRARARNAMKRGGDQGRVTLSGLLDEDGAADVAILDLHEALGRLEALDPRQARIIEMCYFAGMTGDEIAAELDLHRNSVVRELRMARAFLHRELSRSD